MNKKTIFYLSLSISVVCFYLFLLGYRIQAKSIYKEHALAYMSESYEVIVETKDYAIVEFEGVTELITFKNSNRFANSFLPSLDTFLVKEEDQNLSITYPVHRFELTNNYRTVNQIYKSESETLRFFSFTFSLAENYENPFEQEIGYIYVDNNSNKSIEFKIWNANDQVFTPLIYTTKDLDSGATLLFSEQVVKERSQLIAFIDGVPFDQYNYKHQIEKVHYKGNEIDQGLFPYVEELFNSPSSYEPNIHDDVFEEILPILSVTESHKLSDGTIEKYTIDFYEYHSKIYMRDFGVFYLVSTPSFNKFLNQIEPTQ